MHPFQKSFPSAFVLAIFFCLIASHALAEDDYEPDNTREQARSISVGAFPRQHNFHAPDDEDWIRFWAISGKNYTIHAENRGDSDIVIELYAKHDPAFEIQKDEGFEGEDERLQFTVPPNGEGLYFARIRLHDETSFTGNNDYWLSVYRPTAPETIVVTGRVRDAATRSSLGGMVVLSDSGMGYPTEPDGYYELHLDPIRFSLETKPFAADSVPKYFSYRYVWPNDSPPPPALEKDIHLLPETLSGAILLLRFLAGAETEPLLEDIHDLTGSGRPGLEDCIYILQKVAEIR